MFFEGTFISFFKDKKSKRSHKAVGIKVFLTVKKSKRSHKAVGIKVFLTVLLGDRRIRIRIQI
jgi:hypothetical protein